MALDMADSYASSATVRVLVSFCLVLTDNTSTSSARTSAIHKEKFNVALSGDEHNAGSVQRREALKNLHWVSENR